MLEKIRAAQENRQYLREKVVLATEEFRSKSRFFVQPSPGGGWSVISADHNRLIGNNKTHIEAVQYAEKLERVFPRQPGSAFTAKAIGERATRWVSLLAVVLVVIAMKASK
ncbi:hypothetical protein [Pseudomonas sp. B26(2017)]|uniref:hypothetical protein n=1 Tax=Pseudomonas sp. B26(2017) TaxID=1981732 RepID=UPI000A1FC768|nr:hypothetical protein [Pseudomonas sp. B26(2017)]